MWEKCNDIKSIHLINASLTLVDFFISTSIRFVIPLTATFLIVVVSFEDKFQQKPGAGCLNISIGMSLPAFRLTPISKIKFCCGCVFTSKCALNIHVHIAASKVDGSDCT